MHIGEGGMALLFLETGLYRGIPAFGKFFERADIQIAIVEKRFQLGHIVHQKAAILPNRVTA